MSCPYSSLPPSSFWQSGSVTHENLFTIDKQVKVASYGSCFAARIAEEMRQRSLNYIQLEDRTSFAPDGQSFSSASGNIYSLAQFHSKLTRAMGYKNLATPVTNEDGTWSNPLRPLVRSYGAMADAIADEKSHNENFLQSIRACDTLILTIGLNEYWENQDEGFAYPICPGCGWGSYDELRDQAKLGTLEINISYLQQIEHLVAEVNKEARLIWTLSPVPLVATHTPIPAVQANILSKAILRASLSAHFSESDTRSIYFPSYEIISNPFTINENFQSDMRQVSPIGVARVMSELFSDVDTPSSGVRQDDQSAKDPCDEENYLQNIRARSEI